MIKIDKNKFQSELGNLIYKQRSKLGMTQEGLADIAFNDLQSKNRISDYELGKKKPHGATLKKLMVALKIDDEKIDEIRGRCQSESTSVSSPHTQTNAKTEIASRRQFITRAHKHLSETSSYRAILTGPFFCHPDWYFRRKATSIQYPDYDKLQKEFLLKSMERSHTTRILVTNSDRYFEKVKSYIDNSELKKLFTDSICIIDEIWGRNCDRGPDLCCQQVGHMHIPYIFDNAALTQFRTEQMTPTSGGYEICDQTLLREEKDKFDTIFDSCSNGQDAEIQSLKSFFQSLSDKCG